MRIKSIKLTNYRQYERAEFSFPNQREKDLHIVLGRNTLGKTDFLNAITWCLYFEEPHLGMMSKALPILNLEAIKNTSIGQTCNVEVEMEIECNTGLITVKRVSTYRKNDDDLNLTLIKSYLEVCTNVDGGNTKIYNDDRAVEWINRIFPLSLREFFFFDGEQLTQFFITDRRLRIETPINEISQVGLLNKITDHLGVLINDLKKKSGKDNPDLQRLFALQETSQLNKDRVENELIECKDQVAQSEEIIKMHSEFLRGQENILELEDRRKNLINQQSEYQEKIDQKNAEFRNFIREYSTYIYLYPRVKKTLDIIEQKESKGQLPPNVDKNFLKQMLSKEECLVCMHDLDDEGKNNIERLIENLEFSSAVSNILVKVKSGLLIVEEKVKSFRKNERSILDEIKGIELARNEIIQEFKSIENRLLNLNDRDAIVNAITERKLHEELKKSNLMKLGTLDERLKKAAEELQKAEENFNQALVKNKDQEKTRLTKEFVENARQIAITAKEELMGEMRIKIKREMQDLFLNMSWSRDKYKEVTIDDEYSLGLLHQDGYEAIGSCSAAERALLALSFTLALHEVSGFDAPLVIDTPSANISDINRINFAKTLSGIATTKQIILLFTPSEYADEIDNVFDQIYSTKGELITPNDGRSVSMRRL